MTVFLRLLPMFLFFGCGSPSQPTSPASAAATQPAPSSSASSAATPAERPTPLVTKPDPSPSKPAPAPQKIDPSPSKPAPMPMKTGSTSAPLSSQSDAPSPETVCAHANEVALSSLGGPVDATVLESPMMKEAYDGCVDKAKKERASDPAGYACDAKCIVAAKTVDDINACDGKCKKP